MQCVECENASFVSLVKDVTPYLLALERKHLISVPSQRIMSTPVIVLITPAINIESSLLRPAVTLFVPLGAISGIFMHHLAFCSSACSYY